jgi:cysteine sulfinate desulfinase/cysteine desulfurase-like protein/rhodanese-related sulfurtransferase
MILHESVTYYSIWRIPRIIFWTFGNYFMSHTFQADELYLDANATSPVLSAAIAAALDAMGDRFGNPSSSHACGLRAKQILDDTRARARRVIKAGPGRVLFTSGATEGIQTAVLSALCAIRERAAAGEACGDLLLVGATEHKAVSESLAHWNRLLGTGLSLQALPVDADGRHRLDVLRELAPRAAMVCTMAANNETGVVSDIDGIARTLRESGSRAYWMVDCVQALGKLPLALADTRIDYAPFSGHKLYAPKGIGMLYVRDGAPYTPLMIGGGQESGQRSGTENMAGIAALGAVLAALEEGTTFRSHAEMAVMRDRLAAALDEAFPGIVFNAPFQAALPTTLNFAVPGMPSRELLDLFDAAGLRVSAGSACSAAKAAPSYVLAAMGLPLWRSSGAVRLSFGPLATTAFIDEACARIRRCGQAARSAQLAPSSLSGNAHGLLQVSADGRHGWIAFDLEARSCIAIDPPLALAPRIASLAGARGLRMAAVLGTGADPDGAAARAALRAALGQAPADPGPLGWPSEGHEIAFGKQVLSRLPGEGTRVHYLLETPDAACMAFTGDADGQRLPQRDMVLCHGVDIDGLPLRAVSGGLADDAPAQLAPAALDAFLRTHADALLVDVREQAEFEAGACRLHGRAALNVPLSRLAEHLAGFLATPRRPLVFVCRSGNRSARAALALRRGGHAQAWTVTGGIALAGGI